MTFKIHAVYKEKAKTAEVLKAEEEKKSESQLQSELSLEPSSPQNGGSIEQQRKAVLNGRTQVKPGTKISVKPSAYEKGYESDMY
jgi:hypothetical protein